MSKIDLSKLITADDKFEERKKTKIAELDQACAAEIVADFKNKCLGKVHTYPSKPTDQANLSASVIDSLLPEISEDWVTPFWCADSKGVWEMREHTAKQIQTLGCANKARILACLQRNAALARLADSLEYGPNAQAELDEIVW